MLSKEMATEIVNKMIALSKMPRGREYFKLLSHLYLIDDCRYDASVRLAALNVVTTQLLSQTVTDCNVLGEIGDYLQSYLHD